MGRARANRERSAEPCPPRRSRAGPGATLLVWRQEIAVYHRAVDPEERAALALVSAGSRFGVICDALSAAHGDEAAAARAFAWLSTWISDGLLANLTADFRVRPTRARRAGGRVTSPCRSSIRPPAPTGGLHAAATERNRGPILEVLRRVLPPAGLVLEIASGTGQHVAFFARELPALRWQPSDPSPVHLDSIRAWTVASGADNVAAPLQLDVELAPWPVAHADAILNINMIHIAPWSAAEALFRGAARLLPPAGVLFLYGPFKRDGQHTAESNARFDERLRGEDARWGVRDLGDVQALAAAAGFAAPEVIAMPANNLSLVFRRNSLAGS